MRELNSVTVTVHSAHALRSGGVRGILAGKQHERHDHSWKAQKGMNLLRREREGMEKVNL